jgi:hypothetical protein
MVDVKQRHGCLTAWLILMLIGNSLAGLLYLFASGTIRRSIPNASAWALPAFIVVGIANIVFYIALFDGRNGNSMGCLERLSCRLSSVLSLSLGVPIVHVIFGVVGFLILFGVLGIGGDKKA